MNMFTEVEPEIQQFEMQVRILKVLTHPARLAILNILRDGEQCVCHMEAHLGLRQAYISQQLSVLREAGLIQDRREGWNIFYRVTDERIYDVLTAVGHMTDQGNQITKKPKNACTCPKCSAMAAVNIMNVNEVQEEK